jgi:hypothetical protein
MTVVADRQFTLQFDGALTMTHHATNLDLPGEANITTAAGDVATFQSTGSNTVQCINYTRADGSGIAGGGDFSDGGEAGGAARTIGNTDAYDFAVLTNNVEQIQVEGDTNAGIITTPNQSACSVEKSATQTISNGVHAKIECNTELYDIQNEYDNVTNYRFTAIKAGKYLIIGKIGWGSPVDGARYDLKVRINNVDKGRLIDNANTTSQFRVCVTYIFDLAASDYLELFVYQNSGDDDDVTRADQRDLSMEISKIA